MARPRQNKFNETELALVERMKIRGKLNNKANSPLVKPVEYVSNGNFTYAVVQTKEGMFVGGAKRNPRDLYNLEVGKAVAFTRAISK